MEQDRMGIMRVKKLSHINGCGCPCRVWFIGT